MYNKQFIYEYWNRTEFGRAIIQSKYLSESELLFLMPNNVKRMHGLPLTRCAKRGRNKREYKARQKRLILHKCWNIFWDEAERRLCDYYSHNSMDNFVDVKDCALGDEVV